MLQDCVFLSFYFFAQKDLEEKRWAGKHLALKKDSFNENSILYLSHDEGPLRDEKDLVANFL